MNKFFIDFIKETNKIIINLIVLFCVYHSNLLSNHLFFVCILKTFDVPILSYHSHEKTSLLS